VGAGDGGQAELVQQVGVGSSPGEARGEADVVAHREVAEQPARLGQHSDVPRPEPRRLCRGAVAESFPGDVHVAAVRIVEATEQTEERRLARARRSRDRKRLSRLAGQRHVEQGADLSARAAVEAVQSPRYEGCHWSRRLCTMVR
jgi:hypothetical protein